MKVKSESEVAQSCRTLSDPMDCSPTGSSNHGIFQARVLEWGAIEIVQTFPKLLSLNVKCLSYREYVDGSCFYIQSYNLCPLIGKFNPFTFKIKLKIELPHDPAILLLGIYPEKNMAQKDTCTPIFTEALFIIARTWKQPSCPSADEWIRQLWYIYTMEYYSAIKKNTFESVLMRWMKLEPIIQSEVSQKEKHHYSILTHIYGI